MLGFLHRFWSAFSLFAQPYVCAACAARLPDDMGVDVPLCELCLKRMARIPVPPGTRLAAVCSHFGAGLELVHAFKYGKRRHLSRYMGEQMAAQVPHLFAGVAPMPTVIVAVPLWSARQRERGFNQAQLLAQEISTRLDIPADFKVLRRVRPTTTQTHLSRKQRSANVRGAFALGAGFERGSLHGKQVLLVDDVFTTGATLRECARTLVVYGGAAQVRYAVFSQAGNKQ